jgi:hypothetical protein
MAILDSQGRLFGKLSLIDIAAALIILLVVFSIFFLPGTAGSVAQLGGTQTVEVDVGVRGLSVIDPKAFVDELSKAGKTKIIIRNQPHGEVDIKAVRALPRTVATPQPDGSVRALEDPRPELDYTADMILTLSGAAQITDDGPVMSNNKIKVGTPLEIEGKTYRFNASVIGVRILE